MGPESIQNGDIVAILFGADAPFILRPTQGYYKPVSEAYSIGRETLKKVVQNLKGIINSSSFNFDIPHPINFSQSSIFQLGMSQIAWDDMTTDGFTQATVQPKTLPITPTRKENKQNKYPEIRTTVLKNDAA